MKLDIYTLQSFCERWEQKARLYDGRSLDQIYDKFFTLFVIYNRLYVESGKILIRENHHSVRIFIKQSKYARIGNGKILPVKPLPDWFGATNVIPNLLSKNYLSSIFKDEFSKEIEYFVGTITSGKFYFYYDYLNEAPDSKRDEELTSSAKKFDPIAILNLIYAARCNMFHGSKEYSQVQRKLISGMSKILTRVITLTKNEILANERHTKSLQPRELRALDHSF